MENAGLDLTKVTRWQRISTLAVLLGFIFLFFQAYNYSNTSTGVSNVPVPVNSVGALGWHYIGLWLPILLLMAAIGLDLARTQRPELAASLPQTTRVIAAAIGILAALCLLIQVLSLLLSSSTVHFTGGASSQGPAFAAYLVLIAGVVAALGAVMELYMSGEPIPRIRRQPSHTHESEGQVRQTLHSVTGSAQRRRSRSSGRWG